MGLLVFGLYGPMASWGESTAGETRSTRLAPTRSAILGLVSAALGIKRDEEARLLALQEGYGCAVWVASPGVPLRDYHTAQVPSKPNPIPGTRRDELLRVPKDKLNTILSRRDYRCDAHYLVALWARPHAPEPLERLCEALRRPTFPLYLGRRSCPLALPPDPKVVQTHDLRHALAQVQVAHTVQHHTRGRSGWRPRVYFDADLPDASVPRETQLHARDRLVSRRRWQFEPRVEHEALLDLKEARP
jgi:CRISPR system Cascade subunit CasD